MSTGSVPALFAGLVDDAGYYPPGSVTLAEALAAHHRHRAAGYGGLIGRLVLPASATDDLARDSRRRPTAGPDGPPGEWPEVAIVGDTGIARLPGVVAALRGAGVRIGQVEAAVAKRGEDPLPGLRELLAVTDAMADLDCYAEIPLTWGLVAALDDLAAARSAGVRIAAKFRIGGLAGELFPRPADLAGVIAACGERQVPFKVTAAVRRAVRHNDPETGFTHHGLLNLMAACLAAAAGAPVATLAERLAATDAIPLVEAVRARLATDRPLWTSFSARDPAEPVADLRAFGLLTGDDLDDTRHTP